MITMNGDYELFEHTADLGVRVSADTLPALLAPATAGLYATIGTLQSGQAGEPWDLELRDDDPALLLHDYLSEVLHLFERSQRMIVGLDAAVFEPPHLRVRARTAAVDWEASSLDREVKAVTYHELQVHETDPGWSATFIVDI